MSQTEHIELSIPSAARIVEELRYDDIETLVAECNSGQIRAIAASVDQRIDEMMEDPERNRFNVESLCFKGRYLLWLSNNPENLPAPVEGEEIELEEHQQAQGGLLSMRSGLAREVAERSAGGTGQGGQSQDEGGQTQEEGNEEEEEEREVAQDGGTVQTQNVSSVVEKIKDRREEQQAAEH